MSKSIQDLADDNLIEAIREHARWQDPCTLVEDGGVLRMAGANAFAGIFRNCAMRIDARVSADEVLGLARDFFAPYGRSYTLGLRVSRDQDLISAAGRRHGTTGRQSLHAHRHTGAGAAAARGYSP